MTEPFYRDPELTAAHADEYRGHLAEAHRALLAAGQIVQAGRHHRLVSLLRAALSIVEVLQSWAR
jgi:hypothetical protein